MTRTFTTNRTIARFRIAVPTSAVSFKPSFPVATSSGLVRVIARTHGNEMDANTLSKALLAYLRALPQAKACILHVIEGGPLDVILATMTGTHGEGLGWEGMLFPQSDPASDQRAHKARTMPRGCSLVRGISTASVDQLKDLHPQSGTDLAGTHLRDDDSFLLIVNGDIRGWIPVHRFNATTVSLRSVLHDSNLYADEPRRRSFLRLAAWSQVARILLDEKCTVITWMPDDGDPINEYKLKVGSPDWLVHWVSHVIEPAALRHHI